MTKIEYNELRYKLETRQNRYLFYRLIICFVLAVPLAFLMKFLTKNELDALFISWLIFILGLFLILGTSQWNRRINQLEELYKSNTSYAVAFEILRLGYEPPSKEDK